MQFIGAAMLAFGAIELWVGFGPKQISEPHRKMGRIIGVMLVIPALIFLLR